MPRPPRERTIETQDLVGGLPCLDFVNTVAWRGLPEPRERLRGYGDLLVLCGRLVLLSGRDRTRLMRLARRQPVRAERAVERACEIRESLHRLLLAWRSGTRPGSGDVAVLNAALAAAPRRDHLVWRRGRVAWHRHSGADDLESPLWPLLWSGADLLVQGEPAHLGVCAAEDCGWLFYDSRRGPRRRWCSMSACGNRAKARRFQTRPR